jgi:lipopolysaccharide export system protein LptC
MSIIYDAGDLKWGARRAFSATFELRRRILLRAIKYALPLMALSLLTAVAFWPKLMEERGSSRISYTMAAPGSWDGQGSMTKARYRSSDDRGNPYTVTAEKAVQVDEDTVAMIGPAADTFTKSKTWQMLQSRRGTYHMKTAKLELSDHVVLYRDDGTTITTSSSDIDLKTNTAKGHEAVNAAGPFGKLQAEGFTITDRGQVIRFTGAATLVSDPGR